MVVACCLVNRTTWEKARLVHSRLKLRYGGPEGLASADPEDLQPVIRRLGLWRQRSKSLVRMARTWLQREPETSDDVAKLPGCGKYAADSWAIFIENRVDVYPRDGKLNWYIHEQQPSL
jgi:endonuclease III